MNNLLVVLLDETAKKPENNYMFFIMIGLMIVVFYFFMIRPQQKAAKKARSFADSLTKGDKVITNTGMFGKIVEINEGNVSLEIASNVKIKVLKSAITSYQDGTNVAKNSDGNKNKEEKVQKQDTNEAEEAIIQEGK